VATPGSQCFYGRRRAGAKYDAHNNAVGQSGAAGIVMKEILKTKLRKEEEIYFTGDAALMRAG